MRKTSLEHAGPWKSTKELQLILRELGMRQTIYTLDFEGPNLTTFTAGVKANILHSVPAST